LRVLFDKNVPYGLRRFLGKHEIESVDDRGWARLRNGDLLRTAEDAGFEVVITADQNIVYQQNLRGRTVSLIVLGSNIWPIVQQHATEIAVQVRKARPESYAFIEMSVPKRRAGGRRIQRP
jgi:predicted nuclease of predicted toxin-antitoxin system